MQTVLNIIILCKQECIRALFTYQVMGQRCGVWDNNEHVCFYILDVFINSLTDRFEHRFEGSNRVTFEYGLIRRIAIKITQSTLFT